LPLLALLLVGYNGGTRTRRCVISDLGDDQQIAESLDEDEIGDDLSDFPPDHGVASLEATVVTDTGDVPEDSVEEREWREWRADEDGDARNPDPVELIDDEWSDPGELDEERERPDGELLGETGDPEDQSAEEDAVHVVDDDR
jgi:hypothetical protein